MGQGKQPADTLNSALGVAIAVEDEFGLEGKVGGVKCVPVAGEALGIGLAPVAIAV